MVGGQRRHRVHLGQLRAEGHSGICGPGTLVIVTLNRRVAYRERAIVAWISGGVGAARSSIVMAPSAAPEDSSRFVAARFAMAGVSDGLGDRQL